MDGTSYLGETKYETTGSILIVGITFDDFTCCYGLTNFVNGNMSNNADIDCMLRKLESICRNFAANLFNHFSVIDNRSVVKNISICYKRT